MAEDTCIANNCTRPILVKVRGLCDMHYRRWHRSGDPNFTTRTPPEQNTKHPLYPTWAKLRDRCNNPKYPAFQDYGGRGIKVCDRWSGIGGFINFLEDMGDKPSEKHSIDRKDNNGDYSPENCRWATQQVQALNRRVKVNNTSGTTGVYFHKQSSKWIASVTLNYKTISLGSFDRKEDAIKARRRGEAKYYKPLLG